MGRMGNAPTTGAALLIARNVRIHCKQLFHITMDNHSVHIVINVIADIIQSHFHVLRARSWSWQKNSAKNNSSLVLSFDRSKTSARISENGRISCQGKLPAFGDACVRELPRPGVLMQTRQPALYLNMSSWHLFGAPQLRSHRHRRRLACASTSNRGAALCSPDSGGQIAARFDYVITS